MGFGESSFENRPQSEICPRDQLQWEITTPEKPPNSSLDPPYNKVFSIGHKVSLIPLLSLPLGGLSALMSGSRYIDLIIAL